jgi:RimJ/RimL family protein N-acetyltransferase
MYFDTSLLRGKYVYLELLHPNHFPVLKQLARDERIWEFTKTLIVNDSYDEQVEKYLLTASDQNAMGGQESFVVRQTGSGSIIGMTRAYFIEPKDKKLAIGYTWYNPEVWGKPHNKECKLLLLQYIFETLQFNRVEFHVAHQNIRSQKAVEKIGGVKEGVLRKHGYRNDGSIRHTVIFSIINDEWPGKKTALMQLLSGSENKVPE